MLLCVTVGLCELKCWQEESSASPKTHDRQNWNPWFYTMLHYSVAHYCHVQGKPFLLCAVFKMSVILSLFESIWFPVHLRLKSKQLEIIVNIIFGIKPLIILCKRKYNEAMQPLHCIHSANRSSVKRVISEPISIIRYRKQWCKSKIQRIMKKKKK